MRPQKTPAQLQPGDGEGNQSAAKLRAKAARGCRLAEPSNMTRRPPRLRALAESGAVGGCRRGGQERPVQCDKRAGVASFYGARESAPYPEYARGSPTRLGRCTTRADRNGHREDGLWKTGGRSVAGDRACFRVKPRRGAVPRVGGARATAAAVRGHVDCGAETSRVR